MGQYRKRHNLDPCIWILLPDKLNESVYDQMVNSLDDFEEAFLEILDEEKKDFVNDLKIEMQNDNKSLYFSVNHFSDNITDITCDKIYSLCVLEDFRKSNMYRMKKMLLTNEFNPLHYMLLRTYVDAFPTKCKVNAAVLCILPPLAILHSYQSERIRAQRGMFTGDKTVNVNA